MADNEIDIIVKLKNDISAGLGKISSSIQSLQPKFNALSDAGKNIAIGFGAISTGLGLFIKNVAEAAGESERVINRLNQTLINSGQYSERLSKSLQEQAKALQEVTTFSDESIISAQAAFARYRLNEDQIKKLTQATLDLATFTGEDLDSAALKVARSVGTSTNALMRNGIALDGVAGSSQRVESAIKGINAQVGGQAIAAANTYSGAIKNLQNVIDESNESIGREFLPILKQITLIIRDVVIWFTNLSPAVKKAIAGFLGFSVIFVGLVAGIGALATAFGFLGTTITGAAVAATGLGISLNAALFGIPIIIGTITTGALLMYNVLNKGPKTLKEATDQYNKLTDVIEKQKQKIAALKKLRDDNPKDPRYYEQIDNETRLLSQQEAQLKKLKKAKDDLSVKPSSGGATPLDMPDQKKTLEQQLKDFEDSEKAKTSVLEKEAQKRIEILSTKKATEEEIGIASDELELARLATKQENLDAFEAQSSDKSQQMKEFVAKQETDNQLKKIKLEEDLRKKKDDKAIKDFNTFNDFMKAGTTSKSKEVAAISKALAIYEIGVNTYKAAMAGYSAMAGIPFVGPALGIAAASAAIAFGGEQAQAVSNQQPALAEGGIVPATNGGRSVTVAEGGQDEAIIPLDKAEGLGGDLSVNLNVDGIKLANVVVNNYNRARDLNLTGRLSTI